MAQNRQILLLQCSERGWLSGCGEWGVSTERAQQQLSMQASC